MDDSSQLIPPEENYLQGNYTHRIQSPQVIPDNACYELTRVDNAFPSLA